MTLNVTEERALIRKFIQANMDAFYLDEEFADTDNIFERGFVSSLFAMQLLQFIEREFNIEVPDTDINLVNFSSVDHLHRLVDKVRGGVTYAP